MAHIPHRCLSLIEQLFLQANLVAGEDPIEITSGNLAISCLVVDSLLLRSADFSVTAAVATANSDVASPSFGLPSNLLVEAGVGAADTPVSVLATNFAINPYDAQENGALAVRARNEKGRPLLTCCCYLLNSRVTPQSRACRWAPWRSAI
jgi:hypothetical protein